MQNAIRLSPWSASMSLYKTPLNLRFLGAPTAQDFHEQGASLLRSAVSQKPDPSKKDAREVASDMYRQAGTARLAFKNAIDLENAHEHENGVGVAHALQAASASNQYFNDASGDRSDPNQLMDSLHRYQAAHYAFQKAQMQSSNTELPEYHVNQATNLLNLSRDAARIGEYYLRCAQEIQAENDTEGVLPNDPDFETKVKTLNADFKQIQATFPPVSKLGDTIQQLDFYF